MIPILKMKLGSGYMKAENERSALILGQDGLNILSRSTIMVFGCGGVGSFCIEALARTGVGHLIVIDRDVVEASNINRQLIATTETIGQAKVNLIKKRVKLLNPDCIVDPIEAFYNASMDKELFSKPVDFVIDCIDSMKSKQDLIRACLQREIPFLCSMGMARRMDPSKLSIMELEKTTYDPMAKRLRQWKRKNHIHKKIMVVSSTEAPVKQKAGQPLPSTIFVPAAAGLILASECVSQMIQYSL